MKRRSGIFLSAVLLVLVCTLAVIQRPATYYALMEIDAPINNVPATAPGAASLANTLRINFVFHPRPTLHGCEALTGNVARVALANCTSCSIRLLQCVQALDAAQQAILSDQPLATASGRMASGAVTFTAADPDLALAACQQAQRQSTHGHQPINCYAPNTLRPMPAPKPIEIEQIALSLFTLLAAAFGAWLACWLIVKYDHLHGHLSHDPTDSGPQKFHAAPTPRIGGIALVSGLLAAGGVMVLADKLPYEREFGLLLLAGIPAFLGGLVEDVTKKVGVLERLLLTMLSGAVAAWLLGAVLSRLDLPGVDRALMWLPFAVSFTVFAVGGVANAINIIDGYNGLAGGYAVIVLAAIAWVAARVGDMLIFPAALGLAGALLGFLKWNWPDGKVFLGDGGAYLLGFILAELSVLIVVRNPQVSPWFPLLLLIHPIFETVYSIYRRKVRQGRTPGSPDALHLHQLVYSRLAHHRVGSDITKQRAARNGKVAPYFWGVAAALALMGAIFWQSEVALVIIAMAYCAFYVASYRRMTL